MGWQFQLKAFIGTWTFILSRRKKILKIMKTVSRLCIHQSVFMHNQESRRPANQLWSSFFTLLNSLIWPLDRGAADSVAGPPTGSGSARKMLDSISPSESSSFSLSSSSSACLFSSLGHENTMKKTKARDDSAYFHRRISSLTSEHCSKVRASYQIMSSLNFRWC